MAKKQGIDYKSTVSRANKQPVILSRQFASPLDPTDVFATKADAEEYAASNPVAYAGQIVAVVDTATTKVDIYKINQESALEPIGNGGNGSIMVNNEEDLIAAATDDNKGQIIYLTQATESYGLGAYVVTGLGSVQKLAVSSATGDSYTVELIESGESATARKTYTIKQGGGEIGKIEIPKSRDIQSGAVSNGSLVLTLEDGSTVTISLSDLNTSIAAAQSAADAAQVTATAAQTAAGAAQGTADAAIANAATAQSTAEQAQTTATAAQTTANSAVTTANEAEATANAASAKVDTLEAQISDFGKVDSVGFLNTDTSTVSGVGITGDKDVKFDFSKLSIQCGEY